MPQQTVIRREFADAVREALGGLSPNQASYKTEISDEWIRKMSNGRVPSEAIVERFARGLDADLEKLRIAAGYQLDSPLKIVAIVTKDAGLSEADQDAILAIMKDALARSKKSEQTGGLEVDSKKE